MKKVYLFLLVLGLVVGLTGCESEEMKVAKDNYNNEVERISDQEEKLNTIIEEGEALLAEDNLTPLDEQTITDLENSISSGKAAIIEIPEMPSNEEEINELVENDLSKFSYDEQINDVQTKIDNLKTSIKQFEQLTNPSEEFVISRIQPIEGITGVAAVTEDNDPNGNLNKAGGYTAQVYFSYSLVDQSQTFGNTLIDKGTQAGGSVEVYKTVEEAEKRNDYLAVYDGSILSSGSHKVVGTVLVRTSNLLTASQQTELESKIIEALFRLD